MILKYSLTVIQNNSQCPIVTIRNDEKGGKMKSIILYTSKYGSTEECAKILYSYLVHNAKIINLQSQEIPDLSNYDNVILGTPIYMGKFSKEIIHFIDIHQDILQKKSFDLFLVSSERNTEYIKNNMPDNLQDIVKSSVFLGSALDLEKLSFIKRIVMKYCLKTESYNNIDYDKIKGFAKTINQRAFINDN